MHLEIDIAPAQRHQFAAAWDVSDLSGLHVLPYRRDRLCVAVRSGNTRSAAARLLIEHLQERAA